MEVFESVKFLFVLFWKCKVFKYILSEVDNVRLAKWKVCIHKWKDFVGGVSEYQGTLAALDHPTQVQINR